METKPVVEIKDMILLSIGALVLLLLQFMMV